jgi:hypothetical protein
MSFAGRTLGVLAIVIVLDMVAGASAATAAPDPGPGAPLLTLELGSCAQAPATDVRSMVATELHRPVWLAAERSAPASGTVATVKVICEGLRASIEIDDPVTGKKLGRVVDLGAAAPVARPHLLALSIVELLAASWVELESNPHPVNPPVGPAPSPEARAAALDVVTSRPGARRGPRLVAGVVAQASTGGPPSAGGGVVVAGDVGSHLGWMADAAFQHGSRSFALGRVTTDNVSVLGALFARVSRGPASVRAGLGARGGGAWLSGSPADAATAVGGAVSGPWWGPVAIVDGSITLRGRIVLELTIEGGRVLLPVIATVQGVNAVAMDGTWIRGGFGVGFTM